MRGLHPGEPREIGEYRLVGGLGDGGQGSVYLGRAPDGGKVAIKVLHARLLGNDRARRRFLQEGETAAKVAGFCTARVYESGFLDGRPYLVSEFIDGPSLQDVPPRSGGALERLAVGTATALAAIHRAGIVHRDFKPSNVLMGPDGPRVIDFGIAREMDVATTASSVVGTPGYMAPEQIAGETATAASDLFSWASTMAFAATGSPLFGRDSIPAVMHRILNSEPELSGISEPLRSVLRDCLAKDPALRPSADEVLMRLLGRTREVEAGEATASTRTPVRRVRGRRVGLAMAGVTTVAVLGVALGLLFNRGPGLVSAEPSYGTPLGGTFGPVGADVTALAMGTYQGKPVVAYADGTTRAIELWDPAAGTRIAALPGMARSDVLSMTMSTAGTLYWSGADGYVRSWDLGAQKPGRWLKLCGRDAHVAVGAAGALLVGCGDGMVKSADPAGGAAKSVAATYVKGGVTALAWDPEGGRTIVGTKLGYVGVGERGFVVKGPVQAVATAGAGQVAVTAAGSTAVYSVATGKPIRTISNQVSGSAVVRTGGDDMIATAADGLNVWSTHESRWLGLLSADKQKVTALAGDSGALVAAVGGRLRAWRLDGYR